MFDFLFFILSFALGLVAAGYFITTRIGNIFLYNRTFQIIFLFCYAFFLAIVFAEKTDYFSFGFGLYFGLVFFSGNASHNKYIQTKKPR